VIYVCADEDGCERVNKHGAHVGLVKSRGLRVEPLHTIKAQALAAAAARRPKVAVAEQQRIVAPA
jgi:hypothetical protein